MKRDRRQIKTRNAILEACNQLLETKSIEQITINDIADTANINRGTFYLHFKDKYEMITNFEDKMISLLHETILKHVPNEQFEQEFLPSRYDTIIEVFKCLEDNEQLLSFLIKLDFSTTFRKKLRQSLLTIIENSGIHHYKELLHPIPVELGVKIMTDTILNVAEYTHETEKQWNKQEVAETIFKSIIQGPAKTLGFIK
ncbi:MAG TPA: TetR/AcrR family transcriptional regulator [Aliicoccus persicus]|uniref:TetR/AcrR family transcriptional regulator n=2 Tax=Aliicoccus persicus TaxID=930138 RepID=A0A921DXC2_9STAP|nr:TetR/AcrR family transcriptional regulator [Aliicoccus persicus]